MKPFFKVATVNQALAQIIEFAPVAAELVSLVQATGRILAEDMVSAIDVPDFARSTMDGYAVQAASTFGASEQNPALFALKGTVSMGQAADILIAPGTVARISTGGMMPQDADSVVMVEHTELVDDDAVEVYRSTAPGQHVVGIGEDIRRGDTVLSRGTKIRPQEAGLLAAIGVHEVRVFKRPRIGIVSTGDEIVAPDETPSPGQVRDINTYALSGLISQAGAEPVLLGLVRDDLDALTQKCAQGLDACDMLLISGGSSVGARDYTVQALSSQKDARILFHGVSISPGKPTIVGTAGGKPVFGLPGNAVSAMVVFLILVRPAIEQIGGLDLTAQRNMRIPARLSRNLPSAQGRTDYVRVRLIQKTDGLWAEPILGKSGLIHTMVKADGLVEIDSHTEGLDQGTLTEVILI